MKAEKKKKKIMAVDDEDLILDLVEDIVSEEFDFCRAASGKEALAIAKEYHPDIAVMDFNMPGMDGYETAKMLRKDRPGCQILMVSGNIDEVMEKKDAEKYFSGFLKKPFTPPELILNIRALSKKKDNQLSESQLKYIEIGQLSAEFAHQLNNPLTYIVNNTLVLEKIHEIIRKHEESPEDKRTSENFRYAMTELPKIIHSIEKGAKRMNNISSLISNSSRASGTEHNPIVYNLLQDIPEFKELVEIRSKRKGICKNVDFSVRIPSYPITAYVDPQHAYDAQINILNNAVDAIEKEGRITLDYARENDKVQIKISDSGQGIPREKMDEMFRGYSSKSKGYGRGIGLEYALKVVTLNRGRLEAESEPGKGSCFTITLPSAKDKQI